MLDHFPVSKGHAYERSVGFIASVAQRAIRSAKDFKELNRTIVFARKWKDRFSRSERLVLLREINSKIRTYV